MKVRKAIIPAAGLGTRFLPATKAIPKEMLPIIDKPTIQFIVEEAVASGIEEILIITSKGKNAIEDHFDYSFELERILQDRGKNDLLRKIQRPSELIDIHYIRQKEPKGLGHAVWCARSFIQNEPFAVLLGDTFVESDVPCLKQMIDAFEEFKYSIVGVQEVLPNEVRNYGIISGKKLSNDDYQINDFIEKPLPENAPSNLAIIGRYILTPSIFKYLETQKEGVGNEIQLTDALKQMLIKESIYARPVKGSWHDVGNHLGYVKAIMSYSLLREDIKATLIDFLRKLISDNNSDQK